MVQRVDIVRHKERVKQTGEVFTPPELVNEILDNLPKDVWSDPNKTFCDPACGDGNFLIEVVGRKIENGASPTQALSTTYGVDIMEDNVQQCQYRLLKIAGDTPEHRQIVQKNIVCADSLTYDFNFD